MQIIKSKFCQKHQHAFISVCTPCVKEQIESDKAFFDSESPEDVTRTRSESIKDVAGHIEGELHQLREYVRKCERPAALQTLREIVGWCTAIENDLK